ncbi:MAG: Wzz/FepE/Etk N-terminal domain-containing protein, partial [SAR324 cluster bacterium]|nr:Wzz/FepE/Etk N-terminal domain-containing protein [SAR324 cluster bacterium]
MPKTESNTAAEKSQPQALQTITHFPQYAQHFEDDTIDLYELWITLWSKKWLVIGVTVITALGSVVFALQQPPVYKAEALLIPPDENKFQSLNVQGVPEMGGARGIKGVQGITSDGAFAEFNKNLSSRILQKKFIQEFGLMELLAPERTPETRDEDIYEDFAKMFKIETDESTSISIELHDPGVAAQWVNDYVKFMDKETISKLIEKIKNSIATQIRDIEFLISSKREMAKIRREDKIIRIEDTIAAKRALVKQRRLDQVTGIENTIAAKREGAKQRRFDQIIRFKEAVVIADSLGI